MSKSIGNYDLSTPLGVGTFSKVRLGTHKETKEKFAVKIMDKELVREEKAEQQISREVTLLKNLDHPNIVKLYDVLETPTHMYLVFELVNGGELLSKIQESGKLDENVARKYFQDLILGIRYCHSHFVAHRDIKPENLLIDSKSGMIKISDFGLANLQPTNKNSEYAATNSLLQTVCGTPNYVAPEVIREEGYNGMIADIWSCGVILFYMLAGYLPFEDENLSVLFNKIERGDFSMARIFSPEVKNLISSILVVDPKKRISLNEICKNPWFNVDFDEKRLTLGNLVIPTTDSNSNAIVKIAPQKKEANAQRPDDGISIVYRLLSINFLDFSASSTGKMVTGTRRLFGTFRGDLDSCRKSIIASLESYKFNPKSPNPREIKGFTNQPKGLLTYQISLIPTISSNLTIFVIKLGRGNEDDFANFYANLVTSLGNSASFKPIKPN